MAVLQMKSSEIREVPTVSVRTGDLRDVVPWRTFRSRRGQRHYSGVYWSATTGGHVIYESRLELARLLFADFDPDVVSIMAQPFRLVAEVNGALRAHVPDFLLLTADGGVVVVDVKPLRRLADAEVRFTFDWTRAAIAECGWGFEVWSEPDPMVLANVRFLAGYRRGWLFDAELVEGVDLAAAEGLSIGEVERALAPRWTPTVARAGLMHVLWSGRVRTDLSRPLSSMHILERA
jgi:hypothetical protein